MTLTYVLSCLWVRSIFTWGAGNREIGFESIDGWVDGIDLIWIARAEKEEGSPCLGIAAASGWNS